MATYEEMVKMLNELDDEDKGWNARTIWGKPGKFPGSVVKSVMWQALRQAEGRGRCYTGGYRAGHEPYTYWKIGAYKVTYFTDDLFFNTTMLTEEMMDDLIIEEVY